MFPVWDAVNLDDLPPEAATGHIIAYVDGDMPTYEAAKLRFPKASIITFTTTGLSEANWCDVERYDATPEIGAKGLGRLYMGLYSSKSNYTTLYSAVGRSFPWWAADWNGVPHLVPDSIATQWGSPANQTSPGPYDISLALPAAAPDDIQPPPPYIPPTSPPEAPVPVSPAVEYNSQQHVFQTSYGALWHKWWHAGVWKNEVLTSPLGGITNTKMVIPDQTPQVSIISSQLLVTVEDQTKRVQYFALNGAGQWGIVELP